MPTEATINGMKRPELLDLMKSTIADINKINASITIAEDYKTRIKTSEQEINGEEGILAEIRSASEEVVEKLGKIQEAYVEIVGDEEDTETLSIKDELNALVVGFNENKKQIEQFRQKIFGFKTKNEAGETIETKGLSKQIEEFFANGKKEYERLMDDINNRLSPGATSVELAKTFEEKVAEYKKSSILWARCFIIIVLLASVYYGFLVFFNTPAKTAEEVWVQFLFRAPFLALVLWLAMFISNRRAESKKLEEAYKHKEVMARTYTGYRKAIEDLEDDDADKQLLKTHMGNLLKAINENSGEFLSSK